MKTCKKCNCSNRIISNAVRQAKPGCMDVCTTPICGDPSLLSIMAPLVYDEIGVNLCATFGLDIDVSTEYPSACSAVVQVINIIYGYGEDAVEIEDIAKRPNCLRITLSNLTVQFAIKLYDDHCNLLNTLFRTALYLPSNDDAPTYNEDTNPTSITLDIFAPYGTSYTANTQNPTRIINLIGMEENSNFVRQGLNLFAIPKLIDLDTAEDEISIGLTLILQSLYFSGYNVTSQGKINVPKGTLASDENSGCLEFVCGDLLDLPIKPLDLNPPKCEGCLKKDCNTQKSCGGCMSAASVSSSSQSSGCQCDNSTDTTSTTSSCCHRDESSCGCGKMI